MKVPAAESHKDSTLATQNRTNSLQIIYDKIKENQRILKSVNQ